MSIALNKFNKILKYLDGYQSGDKECPIVFSIKSDLEKEPFIIDTFGICITGLLNILSLIKNKKILNLNRDYIKEKIQCHDHCSKDHILVLTKEGDKNAVLCIDHLLGNCDESKNCGKVHLNLLKSQETLKGILSFNNPYILGHIYDMIEDKLRTHGYELDSTLDHNEIFNRIRLWMKLRDINKVYSIGYDKYIYELFSPDKISMSSKDINFLLEKLKTGDRFNHSIFDQIMIPHSVEQIITSKVVIPQIDYIKLLGNNDGQVIFNLNKLDNVIIQFRAGFIHSLNSILDDYQYYSKSGNNKNMTLLVNKFIRVVKSYFEPILIEKESIVSHLLGKIVSPKGFIGKKNLIKSSKSAFYSIRSEKISDISEYKLNSIVNSYQKLTYQRLMELSNYCSKNLNISHNSFEKIFIDTKLDWWMNDRGIESYRMIMAEFYFYRYIRGKLPDNFSSNFIRELHLIDEDISIKNRYLEYIKSREYRLLCYCELSNGKIISGKIIADIVPIIFDTYINNLENGTTEIKQFSRWLDFKQIYIITILYEFNLKSRTKFKLVTEYDLQCAFMWYNIFNFDKICISLIEYLQEPIVYDNWLKKMNTVPLRIHLTNSKPTDKIKYVSLNKSVKNENLLKLKIKNNFLSIDNSSKFISYYLNSGLLSIIIGNIKSKRKCISIKKKICSIIIKKNIGSLFGSYNIITSLKRSYLEKTIPKDSMTKGDFGIFKNGTNWGIRINFFDQVFLNTIFNNLSSLSELLKKSYKIRYILKDIIFFSLGGFINEGFETKWNTKDYQILWNYIMSKYSSVSFKSLELSEEDLNYIFKKLKKGYRPKRKESIKFVFDMNKELFMETSNRRDFLEKYLSDCSLRESRYLEDFFVNTQIEKGSS